MSAGQRQVHPQELSKEQLELIERFVTTYNTIDKQMRKILQCDRMLGFVLVVKEYGKLGRLRQDDVDSLIAIGKLRNVLIHDRTQPNCYLAVPAPFVVAQLEKIGQCVVNPPLVGKTFRKGVETISPEDSLASILKSIAARSFSQFPIYDGQTFKGLLTENGITRWLSQHVTKECSLIELECVKVRQVVREEEKRVNLEFLGKERTVEEARTLFAEHELLEAILITQNGAKTEPLLGIITRWDIIRE